MSKKEIILAQTSGFCMGVKKAIQMALDSRAGQNSDIYTIGQLIHNNQVIEWLYERGIKVVEDISQLKAGDTIVVRAHGMPRNILESLRKNGVKIVDATCPHVTASQKKIDKYSQEGYFIIIVGDKNHAEVKGLESFTDGKNYVVISSLKDIDNLPEIDLPICLIAQTTFSRKLYKEISAILTEKYGNKLKVFNSICFATENRQNELLQLGREADAIIVVGGKHSSNTKRLAEIGESLGKPTFHIETASELGNVDLSSYQKIVVTAGASTPDWITESIIVYIETNY
jgi:(E)-4-hydroxy-3-methyl-but-2-enyl pyrophosphate reductase